MRQRRCSISSYERCTSGMPDSCARDAALHPDALRRSSLIQHTRVAFNFVYAVGDFARAQAAPSLDGGLAEAHYQASERQQQTKTNNKQHTTTEQKERTRATDEQEKGDSEAGLRASVGILRGCGASPFELTCAFLTLSRSLDRCPLRVPYVCAQCVLQVEVCFLYVCCRSAECAGAGATREERRGGRGRGGARGEKNKKKGGEGCKAAWKRGGDEESQ
jgi:hypothetical protein